jgi:hypothetical protein
MKKFLTESELFQIEQRVQKASKGPWRSFIEGRDHTSGTNFIMTGEQGQRGQDIEPLGATIADQDFMAAARQDIPLLLAEVHRLKDQNTVCVDVNEALRLYAILEKLNQLFHQPSNYRNSALIEKFADDNYPEIHALYYRVVWDWLPKEIQQGLLNE